MKLKDWLDQEGLTQAEFAIRSGLDQPTISRLIREPERRKPGWNILKAVVDATAGAVTANDFFDDRREPEGQGATVS